MKLRFIIPCLLALVVLAACGANVEATKQKLLASGNEYFEKGQFREAAIMYGRALNQDRRFGEAYFRLAQAQIRLGRFAQAARALHRASELQPENSEAFSLLAEIYLTALESDPLHRDNYIRELEDMLELAGHRGVDSFQLLRVRGYLALVEGKPDDAIRDYEEAIKVKPEDKNVPLALMRALREVGKLQEAEEFAKRQIGKYPDFGPMYDRLYTVYITQKETAKAEGVIEAKCAALPGNSGCQLELAAHYHLANKASRRDELLETLAAKNAGDPAVLASIGDFYERIQDYERAIRNYRAAQQASTARKNFYRLRVAEILATSGRGGDALREVTAVLAEEPKNAAAIALRGAIRLYGGERASVQDAINDMEEVIAEMPKNAVLRYNLGVAYLSVRDVDKALVQFQESAALLPTYQAPRYQLGRIYLSRRQPAMSAQLADEILKLNPASLRGKLLRAEASISLEEYNQARAFLDSALKEDPESADAPVPPGVAAHGRAPLCGGRDRSAEALRGLAGRPQGHTRLGRGLCRPGQRRRGSRDARQGTGEEPGRPPIAAVLGGGGDERGELRSGGGRLRKAARDRPGRRRTCMSRSGLLSMLPEICRAPNGISGRPLRRSPAM